MELRRRRYSLPSSTSTLDAGSHAQAVELAALPEQIRGFGHVKEQAVAEYRARRDELMSGSVKRRAA